ncbi:MAG: DUF5050 domain-containing protein [Rikenellaceae bacterium]
MKNLFLTVAAIATLMVSCINDNPNNNNTVDFKAVSANTATSNQKNCGISTGDDYYIYGCKYDSDGAKLYRKDRVSGETLVLDESARISAGDTSDIGFFNLQVIDGYLYYLPYDVVNTSRSGRLHRVCSCGGDVHQLTDRAVYEYCVYDDKIYYSVISGEEGIYSMGLDGSSDEMVYYACLSLFWVSGGKIYYQAYLNDGYFRSQLKCIDLSDTSTSELIFDSKLNFTYTITEDGELYCLDYSTSSTDLVKVDLETKETQTLVEGVPFVRISNLDGEVYICSDADTETYNAGIYHYNAETGSLDLLLSASASAVCFVGNDEIIYANTEDNEHTGRFWQLYKTDVDGGTNEALL